MSDAGKTNKSGFAGRQNPTSDTSQFNMLYFLMEQYAGLLRTCTIVQVKKCSNAGGLSPVGTVDVQPLVNMVDGQFQAAEHDTIFGLPYFRLQGGKNAVVCDPCKDDIGIMVVADRDISGVKKAKKMAPPGSLRQFDLADGIYIGGILNGTPEQYVRFVQDEEGNAIGIEIVDINGNKYEMTEEGISLTDKNENIIVMDEDGIKVNDVLFDRDQHVSGANTIAASDEITAKAGTGGSVTMTGHQHGTGAPKPAGTNPPTGGT